MSIKARDTAQDVEAQAKRASARGDWRTATELYAQCVDQRAAELALINSVQEGLSSKLDMQAIYDLVGDRLRDTFNAQVVMISQYDPATHRIFHHYAIERGLHLHIPGWQPIDTSRAEIVRTRKPFMISLDEIERVVNAGKMRVVPGTELPKTWLGVPMLVGAEVRGIVSLQNLDRGHAFTASDIDLLMALTNSMSQSLENARLFNETERYLRLMAGELRIARRTQRSILPQRMPRRAGYDFGALITPARAVGGDFYDFIHLGRDRLGLVIGDVSDKGLPAAPFMALTFSLLRAESTPADDPPRILRRVNRYLLRMNASGMFVTLLYGVLECSAGRLRYSRAGHLPPIVLDAQGKVMDVGLGHGQPLGIFEDVALDTRDVVIPGGGLALLFSDGLSEAADAEGNAFGADRIVRTLGANRRGCAKAACARLWEAVVAHSGDVTHQDDFTAVVIRRRP